MLEHPEALEMTANLEKMAHLEQEDTVNPVLKVHLDQLGQLEALETMEEVVDKDHLVRTQYKTFTQFFRSTWPCWTTWRPRTRWWPWTTRSRWQSWRSWW